MEPIASVLIADDDEFFRLAARAILGARLGVAEIVEAVSYDEAVERLDGAREAGHPFALALFDLRMPGMDGPGAIAVVREHYPETRVSVVSASRARRDVLQALEAGAHGYIAKASGARELEGSIRAMLQGRVVVPAFLAERGDEPAAPDAGAGATPVVGLTPRQGEVLAQLVAGKSNKEIARALGLGEGTVKIHVAGLLRALRVSNREAAADAGRRLLCARVA